LAFRGYDEATFTAALRELVAQGLATEEADVFALTETGRKVREEVEQNTDEIFFAAWSELSNGQLLQIRNRLLRLRRNLQALVGDKIAAERKDLWPQVVAMGGAMFQLVRQRTQAVREELGLNRPFAILALFAASAHENGIATAAKLRQRAPYVHPDKMEGYLQNLVETQQLRPGENGVTGAYYITEKGRETIQIHLDNFWGEAAQLQPIPEKDIERIAELLDRVVVAIMQLNEPAKPTFEAMQWLKVPEDATALIRIDHAIDNLSAFRDDAHLATFRVSGHVWETLTDVWQGAANTADAIAERHPNRGYDTADYAQALSELVNRGWLSETDGVYALTEAGQAVRDEAETLTDRYFYAAWGVLNLDEVQELRDLLPKLEAGLKELAEPVAA
jgi:DNA-binding MarR family transcriptional regulator